MAAAAAAAPLLGKSIIPHLRLYLHLHFNTTLPAAVCSLVRRPFYSTTASESPRPIRKPPPPLPPPPPPTPPTPTYDDDKLSLLANKNKNKRRYITKDPKWENDPDYRKWKDKEAEILLEIDPITFLIKDILHSDRYMDGERLTLEDEKTVVEKILAYHPHSEDKIGCGLDSIMVDRHPQFRNSRCLFVVRSDGVWIDFSYQKCIRAYIKQKYPCYGERFIKEHYKRSSS